MKIIETGKKEMKRAARWYFEKASEVYAMTGGNKFWI